MTVAVQADNFERLFSDLVYHANEEPEYVCSPRGQKVRELIAPTITLTDPRARILASPARKADYGFAVGEFLWYWTGRNSLESMLYYNKRMGQFSDDGQTLNSAYGYRTRNKCYPRDGKSTLNQAGATTQWEACKRTLLDDPDSRRALLVIGEPRDYTVGAYVPSKDLPCTLSLQFFIRENKLRLHSTLRSNDIVWGLSYDLFSFTLLQEYMMLELQAAGMKDLELGTYTHTAGSMHIYERHFSMASEVVSAYLHQSFIPAAPMGPISLAEMAALVEDEEALRNGRQAVHGSYRFSGGIRWMGEQLEQHRAKRDAERGR
ncbi:MAG: hypothetical protein A2139_14915 [Desulfobacca sp. RBG_16_60_12]|nr:MAG: hypothetical protein A2139_14915 [Desulfobacca sp. RBG_16_60_12]